MIPYLIIASTWTAPSTPEIPLVEAPMLSAPVEPWGAPYFHLCDGGAVWCPPFDNPTVVRKESEWKSLL